MFIISHVGLKKTTFLTFMYLFYKTHLFKHKKNTPNGVFLNIYIFIPIAQTDCYIALCTVH